jgi:hypothetical protein
VVHEATATEAAIHVAEARLEAAVQQRGTLRAELAGAKATAVTAARVQPAAPTLSLEELQQKILASRATDRPPEQLRDLAMNRAGLMPTYQSFFAARGLSPGQIERFIAISQNRFAANQDVSALVSQGVVAADDPGVEKLRAQIKSEHDAAYRELLGEAGFGELQEIWRLEVARGLVTGFAGMATIYGAALARGQLEQLVRAVASADSGYQAGGRVSSSLDTIDWDQVDAEARPLLTDAQWEIFKNMGAPLGYSWSQSRAFWAITKAKRSEAASLAAPRTR